MGSSYPTTMKQRLTVAVSSHRASAFPANPRRPFPLSTARFYAHSDARLHACPLCAYQAAGEKRGPSSTVSAWSLNNITSAHIVSGGAVEIEEAYKNPRFQGPGGLCVFTKDEDTYRPIAHFWQKGMFGDAHKSGIHLQSIWGRRMLQIRNFVKWRQI